MVDIIGSFRPISGLFAVTHHWEAGKKRPKKVVGMDVQQAVITRNRIDSFHNQLFSSFWGLSASEGFLCLFWFMRLPLSEVERAVFLGYSFTRLTILAIFSAIVLFTVLEFMICLLHPEKSRQMQAALRGWFSRREFLATSLLACLAAWGILGLSAEILLNPAWFPRSILYLYLYLRIRPIFLWSVLVAVQAFALSLACGWYRLRNDPKGSRKPAAVLVWGTSILAVGNLALWGVKAVMPYLFDNQHAVVLAIIIILAMIEVGMAGCLHFRRDQS